MEQNQEQILTSNILVQRLRLYVVSPKPWTYRSKVFLFFVSNFLGISLVKALVSGSASDIPLIQDIVPSNFGAWLSNASLRFFSLAEQCHTRILML